MLHRRVRQFIQRGRAWYMRQTFGVQFALAGGCVLVLVLSTAFYVNVYRAPTAFPTHTVITVERGESLRAVAQAFKEQHIVRSATWLEVFVSVFGGETGVRAGQYFFTEPHSSIGVARALITGDHTAPSTRVTIPEGSTTADIARIISAKMPSLDEATFVREARPYEGFLFPDTYTFLPPISAQEVIDRMRETYDTRVGQLQSEIESHPHSEHEIITMASLLEKEAQTYADKRRIAGILWTRLNIGMPLQVDAVFAYINGKSTFDLTIADLADESLYNTYRYRGLPPGPIANPGLESIRAALRPEETDFLYYLSDRAGNLYYSTTFAEHKRKKAQYLD